MSVMQQPKPSLVPQALSRKCIAGTALATTLLFSVATIALVPQAHAQDQAAPAASVRKLGTVKSIDGTNLSIVADKSTEATVISVPAGTRVLQLAPGSTDLKTAQPSTFEGIAVGDRVLVVGKPGDGSAVVAQRVILMKSADIAQHNAVSEADWQHRGSGGIVTAVDPASGAVSITLHAKKISLVTGPSTIYRRYAADSVKFEDAQPGTLAQIQPGDQLRVRGDKSEDGSEIKAEEIVSGSFRNIAGTVSSIDTAASTVTVKDLTAKKDVVIHLTSNTDLRALPPEMAARFANRGQGAGAAGGPGARPGAEGRPSASTPPAQSPAQGQGANGAPAGPGAGASHGGAGRAGGNGNDLSQMLPHLPTATAADLKSGEALMIVASQGTSDKLTAITVLSGVEPILAATPRGSQPVSLSPLNLGAMGDVGGVQ